MGLILVAKGEDFSGIAIDKLGIYTSVTSGLIGLFETRKDGTTATLNRGPGPSGAVFGTPVFSAASMSSDETRGVDFNIMPTGTHTVAAVFKIRPDTAVSFPAGNIRDNPATRGAEYFLADDLIRWEATKFNTAGGFAGNASTSLAKPAAGNVEMYVVRAENGVRARLENPRTGLSNQVTVLADETFNYPNPHSYSAGSIFNAEVGPDDFYAFAYWNRSLSDAEVATFYSEVKAHLAKRGVII